MQTVQILMAATLVHANLVTREMDSPVQVHVYEANDIVYVVNEHDITAKCLGMRQAVLQYDDRM